MRSMSALALVMAMLLAGCGVVPSPSPEEAVEGMPGPAWFRVTVEPEAALDRRDIVLTSNGDHHVRVEDVMAGESFSGTLLVVDGRRILHVITVPWPPSFMHASVDGTRCVGEAELTEDDEVDVTLVVADDECALTLDRRHRGGEGGHPPPD